MINQVRLLIYGVLFSVAIHLLLFRLTLPLTELPGVRHLQVELGLRPSTPLPTEGSRQEINQAATAKPRQTQPSTQEKSSESTGSNLEPVHKPAPDEAFEAPPTQEELPFTPQPAKIPWKSNIAEQPPQASASVIREPASAPLPGESQQKETLKGAGKTESTAPTTNYLAAEGIDNPPPVYPDQARRRGWEGDVLLRLTITTAGVVEKVVVLKSSGHRLLDRSALRQVRRWRFRAAQQNGRPVTSEVDLPVKFRLR
ncbi:MAG: hypothetical protein C0616_09790 [Desulfuromonas sp.]|nr:MAG: hypothetical protein C0616_09790 [Desulfuromonas sp.]